MTPTSSRRDARLDTLLPRLRQRARRLTNGQEAEDLAQETALRLWQALDRGTPIETPDRYAMILLHNLAREGWRRRRETEELADDMLRTDPAAPARLACADLRAAITRLPEDQARLMALVAEGETSPARLSQLTGVPPGTVMSRLARARGRLRRDVGLAEGASVAELL